MSDILTPDEIAEISAREQAATPGPWGHFYPAARNLAHYGVIRPPNFKVEQDGVAIDAGPAAGIRYQVEGLARVNGADRGDRGAIAYTSEPKSRSALSVDPQEQAFKLAHKQCELDGEFISHARTDIPRLIESHRKLAAEAGKEFNKGVLWAVARIVELHGEPVVAADVLRESGYTPKWREVDVADKPFVKQVFDEPYFRDQK